MTGIIILDKEKGVTSFDLVYKLRKITGEKKIGHSGTLDPMATGVMVMLLGGATRFLDYIPNHDKGYRASFSLGMTTDTLDITGTVIEKKEVKVSKEQIIDALEKFKGVICQLPPMYSAVSVGGKRLYELARKGIEVERQPREILIQGLELVEYDEKTKSGCLDIRCSKGTYVRTLISDIGELLGCGAVMTQLTRTFACGFSLENSVTISRLNEEIGKKNSIEEFVIPVENLFQSYDKVLVTEPQKNRFKNGGALSVDRLKQPLKDGIYTVYFDDEFLGLGHCDCEKGEMAVKRLLVRKD